MSKVKRKIRAMRRGIVCDLINERDGVIAFRATWNKSNLHFDVVGSLDPAELEILADACLTLSDELGGTELVADAKGILDGD